MATYDTVDHRVLFDMNPDSLEEFEKFFKEIGEYFSNLYDDIITNTKTVLKDTYTESENLVKAQYDAWKDSISSIGEKAFKDSFSDLIDGNPEKIADRWIDSLSSIGDTSRQIFSKTIDDLQDKIMAIPGKIASKTFWEPVKALAHFIKSTISGISLAGAGAPGKAFQMGSPSLMMARLGTSPLAAW